MSYASVVLYVVCIAVCSEYVCGTENVDAVYGKPLFLTPLIEEGQIEKARQLSKVRSLVPGENVVSYAGYLTVDKKYNSNLYFWFFPAEVNATKAPVVVWLQGGPGGSSLYGLFEENGPLEITRSLGLKKRQYYWSKNLNVIYIDNPVGTGFSFTDDDAGYSTNEVQVGKNLYEAVVQFFTLFPNLLKNEFFVTGESYAGHYVPALGHTIHQNNPKASTKINLAGVAIGDGWIDPVHMMVYDDYLYQHGFIDSKTQQKMKQLEAKAVKLIGLKKFHQANNVWNKVLAMLSNVAGAVDIYDYLVVDGGADWPDTSMSMYLAKPVVRRSIHVGNLTYHSGNKVYNKLYNDMPTSVAPWLVELMENYRVLLYSGQLDIIVAYPLTTNFVKQLKWSGSKAYANAPRNQWYVGKQLAGYAITVGNFSQVLVRDSGHMVPSQQPKWALDMITKFTNGISFHNKPTHFNEIQKKHSKIRLL